MDRDILDKLHIHFHARPIVSAILCHRDITKQLEVLETQIDSDGRMRCSMNIASTTTGRFSTDRSTTGTGRNLQNITADLRYIFVADRGWKIGAVDKEQAESREVGYWCGIVLGDWSYLDAVESGDIHTYTCRLIWPNLPWTGDLKEDRIIAERPFYRHFTYREITKRAGHGCLTEDHEVLTPNGWVPITDKPKVIKQFSYLKKDKFVEVSNWTDKTWRGDFYEWNTNLISAKMTSDHRIYYDDNSNFRQDNYKLQIHTISEVNKKDIIIPFHTKNHGLEIHFASLPANSATSTNEELRVLCPTVPSGAFYIRRKSKISVTGNSNYLGQPYTIAMELHVPPQLIQDFQPRYFGAFPCIPRMHQWVAQEIQTKGYLVNVFGRRRDFFDRTDSPETIRGAVAYLFQSATADDMNLGIYRLWDKLGTRIQLLLQLHDAVYFLYRESDNEQEIFKQVVNLLDVELTAPNGRKFSVPSEPKSGWNFGNKHKRDKNGKKYVANEMGLDEIKLKA
jgi:hypothetical protein